VDLHMTKLQLLTLMRIHPVVNVSWVVQYKKQVEGQRAEEWEVEKILNKRKVRE